MDTDLVPLLLVLRSIFWGFLFCLIRSNLLFFGSMFVGGEEVEGADGGAG